MTQIVAFVQSHKLALAGLCTAAGLYLSGHPAEAIAALAGVLSGGVKLPPADPPRAFAPSHYGRSV